MSTNVPEISITAESHHEESCERHHTSSSSDSEDNSDSYSNDMDYNQNYGGGLTDVEDFDSYADVERPRSRRSSKNSLAVAKDSATTQGDVTDVEDYNDSEADEEDDRSVVYPELKLSLREFLQHDVATELLSTSNGLKEMVEHKSGDFLQAQNLNTLNDYLTDCEDYNTDSEMENNYEKSVCVDLNETFVEQGRVNIADTTVNTKDNEDYDYDYDEISGVSDMASAVSDIAGKEQHDISEDEVLELSGDEEICQISCSDSESISNQGNLSEEDLLSSVSVAPPLDVAFIHTTNRPQLRNDPLVQGASAKGDFCRKMFLDVKENRKEDVLTDIERFDDSVAEGDDDDDSFDGDDDNQQPIPQAVIMAAGDDGGCITDCEDLLCDDMSETAPSNHAPALSVDLNYIPLPQREVIMLQENKYGDTITNVMPMDKTYQFGMYTTLKDECVTDTEEFSCTDDLDFQVTEADMRSPSPSPSNVLVESDVTVANEVLKTQQSKRLEIISNAESVTDVEEIYVAGTNSRRKKLKRTQSKGKSKYLETPKTTTQENGGGTDIEDMDLSESGLPGNFKCVKKPEPNRQSYQSHSDKVTDVEDITADDVSSVSESELPPIDINTSNFKDYEASSKNIVVTLETCVSKNHKKSNNTQHLRDSCLTTHHNQQQQQQQQTDVEDVQFPSDAEECMTNSVPTVDSCVCRELSEMLNESCTTVHEKCINSFNIDAEKLHIKGMPRESHTDIEYVESDESAARGSK
ncbi:uncharacterized protein LOC135955846 [Calliphora vicina]|uniref:uncharacterized protein LOC135955846 n=1 Tax=Calliphora vicina TaxID=7373 RepID=UPI00325B94DF